MKEYIERQALIGHMEDLPVWGMYGTELDRADVIASVENAPAADVVEVRHAKWENGVCISCGFDFRELTDGENDLEQWVWDEGFNYCPNCGAKIDKEEA